MSIEQAIHQRWRSWQPLASLVPAERLVTGWLPPSPDGRPPGTEPYVLLERGAQRSAQRASGQRTLFTLLLRFHVCANSLSDAKSIAAEIRTRFERQDFVFGEIHVQDMKLIGYQQSPRAAGAWRIVVEYLTRVEQSPVES